jgi:hypothetical protein
VSTFSGEVHLFQIDYDYEDENEDEDEDRPSRCATARQARRNGSEHKKAALG